MLSGLSCHMVWHEIHVYAQTYINTCAYKCIYLYMCIHECWCMRVSYIVCVPVRVQVCIYTKHVYKSTHFYMQN